MIVELYNSLPPVANAFEKIDLEVAFALTILDIKAGLANDDPLRGIKIALMNKHRKMYLAKLFALPDREQPLWWTRFIGRAVGDFKLAFWLLLGPRGVVTRAPFPGL
jgi:hypothetical protein